MNILLDYFFSITAINPTPAASTAFLKQSCLVVKPKGVEAPQGPILCTSMAEVAGLTDNTEAQQHFNAGMSRIYILTSNDLQLAEALEGHEFDFFTVMISSDFTDGDIEGVVADPGAKASRTISGVVFEADAVGVDGNDISIEYTGGGAGGAAVVSVVGDKISVQIEDGVTENSAIVAAVNGHVTAGPMVLASTATPAATNTVQAEVNLTGGEDVVVSSPAMALGAFVGVTAVSSIDDDFLSSQAVIENRCAFKRDVSTGAKNMVFAFGKLLSNSVNWANQQYITMPFSDGIGTLGESKNYFDEKVSFVLDDSQYGKRLALLACGGKAIVAPYIVRNLILDMQSKGLNYVASNQPGYTKVHASLMEDEMQQVIDGTEDTPGYISKGWITAGQVEIKLEQANFVASGYINIAEPGALWRIEGELRQTL